MKPIAEQIWDMKYRLHAEDGTPLDLTVADSWDRVAKALAEAEAPEAREHWQVRFREAMEGYRFLPAGRILAGAGTGRDVTLFNCFVMGEIPDTMEGIFQNLKEAALTMQQGGGIGYDFSTLRPKGAPVTGGGADASGPLSVREPRHAEADAPLRLRFVALFGKGEARDVDHIVHRAHGHVDEFGKLRLVDMRIAREGFLHQRGEIHRAEKASAIRRQGLLAARVRRANFLGIVEIVPLVDAVDEDDARFRIGMSAGSRRGAMMATMRCDHPDIEAFIEAKQEPGRLTMFNLSVLATDAFMEAVKRDGDWELTFGGKTYKTLKARALWDP